MKHEHDLKTYHLAKRDKNLTNRVQLLSGRLLSMERFPVAIPIRAAFVVGCEQNTNKVLQSIPFSLYFAIYPSDAQTQKRLVESHVSSETETQVVVTVP